VAGVGDEFNMVATGIIAAVFLHSGDAGAAGKHFGDGFDFYITQTTGVEERRPTLVSRELILSGRRLKPETTRHINPCRPAGG